MFAPAHHAGDALRRPGAQGPRRAHDLQLPRPADEPGRRAAASSSASPTPAYLDAIAGALRVSGADRALVVSSDGWPRRDEHLGADARRRGQRGRHRALRRLTPEDVGPRRAPARRRRRRHARGRTPRSTRAILAGEPGPRARPRAAQRRRRDLRRRAAPTRSRDGVDARARGAIDSGAAPRALDAYVALQRGAGRARERARPHRRRHPRGRRAPPRARSRWPSSSAAAARGREDRPFTEALTRPGVSVIAEHKRRSPVGGRDPRGRDGDRDRRGLRARRRRRAVDPHRGPALRRLARRPARGARGDARCRSCARTSSSTPTRCTSRRWPAPTRCC